MTRMRPRYRFERAPPPTVGLFDHQRLGWALALAGFRKRVTERRRLDWLFDAVLTRDMLSLKGVVFHVGA